MRYFIHSFKKERRDEKEESEQTISIFPLIKNNGKARFRSIKKSFNAHSTRIDTVS
jgi:hypothetical protein